MAKERPFEWHLRVINDLNAKADALGTEDLLGISARWLRSMASYIGENVAIDKYDDWIMWNGCAPCPYHHACVDIRLFNGDVIRGAVVSHSEESPNSNVRPTDWMRTSPRGVYAYRLSKGTP
jgi:hypothetical protein